MAKKTKFKVGDIVRSNEHITGDNTCAIQNHRTRALAKVSQLKLVVEDENGVELKK